ncbi:hypothetical protein F8S09_14155 [Deinococcus sp. SDU3-2]|uniref:Uncharacterized protein n=1 Tax=Deinococcus terrestris TaxID=2651870 RepID=A0A7X1TSU1_9DEIO|nr:hypothetical protein [Deinococcus terrestris]MPY67811.1 hypothetical protein [Deinococcus terrestris]
MTASRRKRLGVLEQAHAEREEARIEALSSRAAQSMTPAELTALLGHMDCMDTREGRAAVRRLRAWGETVPEIRDAPDLGEAGRAWWERNVKARTPPDLPPSADALADLERYAGQWREVAARGDCPEQDAAEGLAALWAWWAALARALLGDLTAHEQTGKGGGLNDLEC